MIELTGWVNSSLDLANRSSALRYFFAAFVRCFDRSCTCSLLYSAASANSTRVTEVLTIEVDGRTGSTPNCKKKGVAPRRWFVCVWNAKSAWRRYKSQSRLSFPSSAEIRYNRCINSWLSRSTLSLICGWFGDVRLYWISYRLRTAWNSWDLNSSPLSVMISAGFPCVQMISSKISIAAAAERSSRGHASALDVE